MAGSYGHVIDEDGGLRSSFDVADMLENGGDVYEAVEEMYGMIWYLATELALAPSVWSNFSPDDPMEMIQNAIDNHHIGLEKSPTKRFDV